MPESDIFNQMMEEALEAGAAYFRERRMRRQGGAGHTAAKEDMISEMIDVMNMAGIVISRLSDELKNLSRGREDDRSIFHHSV